MTGLSQHYSVRGLEHYLQFEHHILLQRQQLALVTAVLAEQKRQGMLRYTIRDRNVSGLLSTSEDGGPEAIRSIVARLTVTSRQQAVARAALDVASSDDDRQNESCSIGDSSDEDGTSDDEELETGTKFKSLGIIGSSAEASKLSSIAMPPSSDCPRTFGFSSATSTARANMAALRELNLCMLHELQQKPFDIACSTASAVSTSEEQTNVCSYLAHSADEEVEQWSRILPIEHPRRRASPSTMQQEPRSLPFSVRFCPTAFRRDSLALARQHLQQQQQNFDKSRTPQVASMIMPAPNLELRTHFSNDQWSHHGVPSEVSSPSNATTAVSMCGSDSLWGLR